jgi:hypothetical protein
MVEFVPTADCDVTSYNNTVAPLVVDAADLEAMPITPFRLN